MTPDINYDVPDHCIGLYNPVDFGNETDEIRSRVLDCARTMSECQRIAEDYRQRAKECLLTAELWERNAQCEQDMILLALKRLWKIQGVSIPENPAPPLQKRPHDNLLNDRLAYRQKRTFSKAKAALNKIKGVAV